MQLPNSHQTVMPYLMVKGAEGFIEFTEKVFGASVLFKHGADGTDLIMHAEIMIGNSTIMLSDANEQWQPQSANLFVYVTDADEAYNKALALGATSIMEPTDKDYGRSGGVKDAYGNTWWITEVPK